MHAAQKLRLGFGFHRSQASCVICHRVGLIPYVLPVSLLTKSSPSFIHMACTVPTGPGTATGPGPGPDDNQLYVPHFDNSNVMCRSLS